MNIGLSAVNIPPESVTLVNEALATGRIAQAEYVERFEHELAKWLGVKHVIATSSGTMADAVALAAVKKTSRLDRVICPALTFVAQPNSARMNELYVEFVDVDENWTMDWEKHKQWRGLGILFPSDCMGRMALPGKVGGFPYVEDACEAFGSELEGQKAGTLGDIGTFSFFISHTITTGEGGAICTNDDWLAQECRTIRSHGRESETDAMLKFKFPQFGFNAKMSGMTAALGLGVLAHVDEYIAKRRANFKLMNELLGNRFKERVRENIVPHGYPIEFEGEMARNDAMRTLLKAGVECRKFFSCLPTMEGAYQYQRKMMGTYPVAEHIAFTHLYLPCHQNLDEEQIKYMAEIVNVQPRLSRPR